MNARVAVIGFIALLLPLLAPAQDMKFPVFFLRYDGGVGSEEIEPEEIEEEQLEPSSQRHKVTLRIKEEWSDSLTTNLYTAVSRKEYFLQTGSYTYFYLNPDFAWDITDRIQWSTGFRSKWIVYDELDAGGLPKVGQTSACGQPLPLKTDCRPLNNEARSDLKTGVPDGGACHRSGEFFRQRNDTPHTYQFSLSQAEETFLRHK